MPDTADSHRSREARRSRAKSAAERDIAEAYATFLFEHPADVARREACRLDLELFLRTYFPAAFRLPWGRDHSGMVARFQEAILHGGRHCRAAPRGSGKTTVTTRAAIWAKLYKHRRYVVVICATADLAREKIIRQAKTELRQNELLCQDFPQVCFPIRCLENDARRCGGQAFLQAKTAIKWAPNAIVLATLPDEVWDGAANVSGSRMEAFGLTAAVRGGVETLASGEVLRPDFVILDDPQTRESAGSLVQTKQRQAIIEGDVMQMAGPGQDLTALMLCTVIQRGDLADQFLDRKQNPHWRGEKTKALYGFPSSQDLWEEYQERRGLELFNGGDGSAATEFYREHRAAMDSGADVAWEARFKPGELSAVQSCMNILIDTPAVFWAELQNEPMPEELGDAQQLEVQALVQRLNGLPVGKAPLEAQRLTAFVDVQKQMLFWAVCAWADDFTGAVLSYGTWPDQGRRDFAKANASRTLGRKYPGRGLEGWTTQGLEDLAGKLLGLEWEREDRAPLKVGRLLVDCRWPDSRDAVRTWCRRTAHAAIVLAAEGHYVGAASKPWSEYAKKPGEKLGFHWLVKADSAGRRCLVDTLFWKSFVAERLTVGLHDRGALSFYGRSPAEHRLLAEHCCAEYRTRVRNERTGKAVDEWRSRPERGDNDWWDCLVGCAAAASIEGCRLPDMQSAPRPRAEPISLEEMRRRAQGVPAPAGPETKPAAGEAKPAPAETEASPRPRRRGITLEEMRRRAQGGKQ